MELPKKLGCWTHTSKILGCSDIHDTHSGCAYVAKSTQMFRRKRHTLCQNFIKIHPEICEHLKLEGQKDRTNERMNSNDDYIMNSSWQKYKEVSRLNALLLASTNLHTYPSTSSSACIFTQHSKQIRPGHQKSVLRNLLRCCYGIVINQFSGPFGTISPLCVSMCLDNKF